MDIEIGSIGITGLNLDVLPEDLPPSVLSDALNLDFKGRHTEPMVKEIIKAPALPGGRLPLFLDPLYVAGNMLCWIALTEDKAYLYYQFAWVDVTPANMQKSEIWQSTSINGYLLLNNGKQKPLYVDIFNPFGPLKTYDVWPDGLICNVITSLEGILIGCSPTDNTALFNKQMVIWSDISDPGTLPSNFAFTDPASRAGFTTLEGEESAVVAVPLENRIQLYRTNSIYDIAYVGGTNVLSFTRRQLQPNLISRTSVAQYRRAHFGIGSGYFFLFNGFDIQPIGQDVVCETFFETLNREYAHLISVLYDSKLDQIIIAYPEQPAQLCNRALIYDLNKQLWKKRALPDISCTSSGFFPRPIDVRSWDELTETWATWEDSWGISYTEEERSKYVMGSASGFFKVPDTGSYMPVFGQRLYLASDSKDVAGNPVISRNVRKMMSEFWMEYNGQLKVRFGGSEVKGQPVNWEAWKILTSNTDVHSSYITAGKFISMEISNEIDPAQPSPFTFGGYNIKLKSAGRY